MSKSEAEGDSSSEKSKEIRLHAQINGHHTLQEEKPFTVYNIQVIRGKEKSFVQKRYSEFDNFHQRLQKTFGRIKLPELPPKRAIGSLDPDFVKQRKTGLDSYLKELLANPLLRESKEFYEFLGVPHHGIKGIPNPEMKGFLVKQGYYIRSWKKRFFVLKEGKIYYFEGERENDPRGMIDLSECTVAPASQKTGKEYSFGIFHPRNRTFLLYADKEEDLKEWFTAIHRDEERISIDDFELLCVIGKGSFGKVLQVMKKDNKKIFAMKVLRKDTIRARNQVEHTKTERNILQRFRHPFIVELHYAFQTEDKLYMVLDFVNGGELFSHLKREKRFKEERAKLYAAEVLVALGYLHEMDIVYRDLKPENILLGADGHIKVTDFGLSKEQVTDADSTYTFCGTPEYMAPEILMDQGHGKPVDWWSFGILVYEMLTGLPPFYSRNKKEMYFKILKCELRFPQDIGADAKDLIQSLLKREPGQRLGSSDDAEEIKKHK